MRYQNWDALLFPDGVKVPLQEFKTACHVARDRGSPFLQNPAFANVAYSTISGGTLSMIPVLTTFVGSLKHGDKFRVSVHSWTSPIPSSALRSYMSSDATVMFEARVYIDSQLMASHLFDHRTVWPVVIDTNTQLEQEGYTEPLCFPPFHESILRQDHWEPSESYGRIKVVITEGFARGHRSNLAERAGFDRFRDVIAFSFQHAPINILEISGIAWPNPGMWRAVQRSTNRQPAAAPRPPLVLDQEAHAHSPRRPDHNNGPPLIQCYNDPQECFARNCTHPIHFAAMQLSVPPPYQASWNTTKSGPSNLPQNAMSACDDPFMGPPPVPHSVKQWSHPQTRSSSHDVSMPDYLSSKSAHSREYTDMSGVSYSSKDFEMTINEAAVEEIVKALSPARKDELAKALSPQSCTDSGTQPPANTPSGLPQTGEQDSPAVQARAVSYGELAGRNASLEVNPSIQHSRNASQASSRPEQPLSAFGPPRCSDSPASSIQSRKERFFMDLTESDNPVSREPRFLGSGPSVLIRDPLTENSETNRRRSASTASKRKISISTVSKDDNGKSVLAGGLIESVHSPIRGNDGSPNDGGVALGIRGP